MVRLQNDTKASTRGFEIYDDYGAATAFSNIKMKIIDNTSFFLQIVSVNLECRNYLE